MSDSLLQRSCVGCGGSMLGKRSHARYCSRTCKTAASDRRRVADGREQARNLERYSREAEHRRAQARQYLRDNPERMRAVRRRRKGQLRAEALLFTERDWRRLVARYRECCAYCGVRDSLLQREHVIPLARGGRHGVGNILPACARCNGRKKTKFLSEWRLQALRRGEGVTPHPTHL